MHHHLLETNSEIATALELIEKLMNTTPSGWWWWFMSSLFRQMFPCPTYLMNCHVVLVALPHLFGG